MRGESCNDSGVVTERFVQSAPKTASLTPFTLFPLAVRKQMTI
jgi:hypothetical protein